MHFVDLALFAQRGAPPGMPTPRDFWMAILIPLILGLLVGVFAIICWWKIFTKAGEPGWAAIVPVYQGMVWARICGRGEMFGLLLLVPCVNFIIAIMLIFDTARVFGKSGGFAVGLLLLGIVFLPMLAFGDAQYVGDRPSRGRRRGGYDDDDEDDRPRRKRVDDDEDDAPRRRPAADDRVRRRPADEEDDRPRRRPAPRDEDDEPPPRPRRPPGR